MNSSLRQGTFLIFIFLLSVVNYWLGWFGISDYFLIVALGAVVMKLTDIEEAIRDRI